MHIIYIHSVKNCFWLKSIIIKSLLSINGYIESPTALIIDISFECVIFIRFNPLSHERSEESMNFFIRKV